MNTRTTTNGASIPTFDEVWDNWEYYVEKVDSGPFQSGLEGGLSLGQIAEVVFDLRALPPEVQQGFRIDLSQVPPEVLAQIREQYPLWFAPDSVLYFFEDPGESQEGPETGR